MNNILDFILHYINQNKWNFFIDIEKIKKKEAMDLEKV